MTMDVRQEWETPPNFWEVIDAEFDFQLDACATAANAKCKKFWTPQDNSLVMPWATRTWCNPGFKKDTSCLFLVRSISEARRIGIEAQIVTMGLVNPSTEQWAGLKELASEIRMLLPRVQFVEPPEVKLAREAAGLKKSSNGREHALFIFRYNPHNRPADIWTWRWKG